MRRFGETPLFAIHRQNYTNQRLQFAIRDSTKLLSGDEAGTVTQHYIGNCDEQPSTDFVFQAHGDVVNGLSVHPHLDIIATASGSRCFPEVADDDSDGGSDDDSDDDGSDSVSSGSTSGEEQSITASAAAANGQSCPTDSGNGRCSLRVWALGSAQSQAEQ